MIGTSQKLKNGIIYHEVDLIWHCYKDVQHLRKFRLLGKRLQSHFSGFYDVASYRYRNLIRAILPRVREHT
jgi:hypothetical protein